MKRDDCIIWANRALNSDLWVEVYLTFDPRPRCRYEEYLKRIRDLVKGGDLE